MDHFVIEVEGLTKKFNQTTVLSDVSFNVREGEIFGLLGPNGAGKTTTLRILAGILAPSGGKVKVLSFPLPQKAEKIKKHLGYLSQKATLYQTLTAVQNFHFYCGLYGLSDSKKIDEAQKHLFSIYGLDAFKNAPVKHLSGGFKQRLALSCALAHKPKILLLDEPTVGIDPVTRRELWDHFYELSREHNMTLVITTHYLEEAERCDKIALLGKGKLFLQGTPQEIVRDKIVKPVIAVELAKPFKLFAAIKDHDGFTDVYEYGKCIKVVGNDSKDTIAAIKALAKTHRIAIGKIERIVPSIEDVFIQLTNYQD